MIWDTWVQFPKIYLMPKYPNAANLTHWQLLYKIKIWLDVIFGAE